MGLFSRKSDAQLEHMWQQAKLDNIYLTSVREIDHFIENLRFLKHAVSEDKMMAVRFTEKMMESPLVNYNLSISPALIETQAEIGSFLRMYSSSFNQNSRESVKQALFDVAVDGQIDSLIRLCENQQKNLIRIKV